MENKRFKELFPNILKEIESKESLADIKFQQLTIKGKHKWASYSPDVIDFLRRCDNVEEAFEILRYLKKHGELSQEDEESIVKQLKEKGIRSFGSKKDVGYYYKANPSKK